MLNLIWIGIFNIGNIGKIVGEKDSPNIEGYKVLSINDFSDIPQEKGDLTERVSLLIPKSYEYYSRTRGYGSVNTEYAKALTENLASNLVHRYIRQAETGYTGRYGREVELYFTEGFFDDYLLKSGLVEKDLYNLKDKDIKEAKKSAMEIIQKRSIVEDKETLYNVDEAYFSNYEKTELVLRNGKEVFYLEGKDFSDNEIVEIVKDKLDLN